MSPPHPAIFLDRDGVLNEVNLRSGRPHPPQSMAEFRLIPGAAEACAALQRAGYRLFVITNQPDVARGAQSREVIESFHAALLAAVPSLDEIVTCYHDDADSCACRKPKPGLILDLAERHHLDLAASFVIGDRWRDIAAGQSAGCQSVFIDYRYMERQPSNPTHTVNSIAEAADWIVESTKINNTPTLEDPLSCR